jgi:serine/threonine-protein kinase
MGEVYLAEDTKLHRPVALKILPGEFASDARRMQRFAREAHVASAISHPNVAVIYEVGDEQMPFIAMEYVQGQTLAERISGRPVPVSELLDLAIEVAEAFEEAHARGVVHRDLKPANIMVTARGHVKVLDFGLAKFQETTSEKNDTSTQLKSDPEVILGTIHYMSPEQALGHQVDQRSDIFSFGAVLYEMATGRQAFAGSKGTETISRILHEQPEPITRLNYAVPSELERIIRKCLEKDRESRYQAVHELLVDLRNLRRDSTSAERPAQVVRGRRWWPVAFAAAALLAFAAAAVYMRGAHAARRPIDSLAVLPFVNTSRDAQSELLADGMTETIINKISELPQLKVMSRSTMFRYKGRNPDPQQVGRELKVSAVLAGRVVQIGDRLDIHTELVNVSDGSQLWGERYDRRVADIFALQDDIAREISSKLRLKLTGEEEKRLTKRYTENPEAYDLYVKGRFYWNKRTASSIQKALELFNQAAQRDPNYALAYLGIADCYAAMPQYAGTPNLETQTKVKAALLKALDIDPGLAEAHTSLGFMHLQLWEWREAETEFKRAIELKPNYATAYHWYALYLRYSRRKDEALAKIKQAQALDPLSLIINTNVGIDLDMAGRRVEAIEQYRRTIELDPNFGSAHMWFGKCLFEGGETQGGIRELERAVELTERSSESLSRLGFAYARAGRTADALKIVAELKEELKQKAASPFRIGYVYAGLDNRAEGYRWFEEAYQERDAFLYWLNFDPELQRWRSDPQFQDLLRRMGLAS